jgi:hypothetical protein
MTATARRALRGMRPRSAGSQARSPELRAAVKPSTATPGSRDRPLNRSLKPQLAEAPEWTPPVGDPNSGEPALGDFENNAPQTRYNWFPRGQQHLGSHLPSGHALR